MVLIIQELPFQDQGVLEVVVMEDLQVMVQQVQQTLVVVEVVAVELAHHLTVVMEQTELLLLEFPAVKL